MIYLSGCVTDRLDAVVPANVGWMLHPHKGNKPTAGRRYAADNGCFTAGDRFDGERYLRWLDGLPMKEQCLFAVAPDVVGDAAATAERARPYLGAIRQLGLPVAYVGQDGELVERVPWDEIDAYFVGGTNDWKLTEASQVVIDEARRRGKWVHIGRINSVARAMIARRMGADSVDGTFLIYGPDKNLPRFLRMVGMPAMQRVLVEPGAA